MIPRKNPTNLSCSAKQPSPTPDLDSEDELERTTRVIWTTRRILMVRIAMRRFTRVVVIQASHFLPVVHIYSVCVYRLLSGRFHRNEWSSRME
ncbi:hypothetical protein GYMLUDRAFT_934831 [Collybiopsis luxurians FD-317 M1]|nr:hypothetical protein GYMLUDRAFT_934831 [Collybiopsis luxurians FD-317 M1]